MRRLTSAAILLSLFAVLAACSGSEDDPGTTVAESGGEADITIADFAFSGADTVSVGDTVTVTNEDTVGHTWTADEGAFDSGTLATGDSFEFTFDEAGEFSYVCTIHPQMTGTITVEG